jgi:hypothetical protein
MASVKALALSRWRAPRTSSTAATNTYIMVKLWIMETE